MYSANTARTRTRKRVLSRNYSSTQIVEALQTAGKAGMTRTEIRDLFKRHKSADRINYALTLLLKASRVYRRSEATGGRKI